MDVVAEKAVRLPLSHGHFVLVDAMDLDLISGIGWYAKKARRTRYAYGRIGARGEDKRVLMHRLLTRVPADLQVDHWDGDGLNNTRQNLRVCTHAQNQHNQAKTRGISRFKGVAWHKRAGKWSASIRLNGKSRHLGLFGLEESAASAYDTAAVQLFGEFACLNFPGKSPVHGDLRQLGRRVATSRPPSGWF